MTVLSAQRPPREELRAAERRRLALFLGGSEGRSLRLAAVVQPLAPRSRGRCRAEATERCFAASGLQLGGDAASRNAAADFLFCGIGDRPLRLDKLSCRRQTVCEVACDIRSDSDVREEDEEDEEDVLAEGLVKRRRVLSIDVLSLPPFEPAHLALLLPAAAASLQLGDPTGVAQCCIPIIAPFSMPPLSASELFANKRALAYNRCVILSIYAQGAFAVLKFASGNMMGGFFDGVQAGMGYYALTPDGLRLFPTYMMMAGFNGFINLLQVLQMYNGIPLHWLPMIQLLPPVVSITSAYFSWQFCKELRTIASGIPPEDPQNSCFIRTMAGDWWPACLSGALYGGSSPGAAENSSMDAAGGGITGLDGASGRNGANGRFTVFEGSGHRLGAEN